MQDEGGKPSKKSYINKAEFKPDILQIKCLHVIHPDFRLNVLAAKELYINMQ